LHQLPTILKKARQALDLTQEDVAKRLGISQRAYAFYEDETNDRIPKPKRLAQLGEALNIPINTLMRHYSNGIEEKTAEKEEAVNGHPLPGSATLQDLLNEKDQRIKDIESSRQKIESLLAEANEEKRQLIATLRENMRLQEQQLKTMEANLVRGHDEIKGLLFSSNKYWEDVLIGEVGLLSGKRKVVGKKAGISRPGK
jgi:transcriptional regulator with XRE-family HTH domain